MLEKPIDHLDVSTLPTKELQALVHELRVHQIELEMQNDELKKVQLALEASRDEFQELYDFSPVGYFTLTKKGLIIQANLTGAALFGMSRPKLIHMRFGQFVTVESEAQLYRHFLSVLKQGHKQDFDLTLKRDDGSLFYARLESIRTDAPVGTAKANGATHAIRMAVIDISDRKKAEDAMRSSEELFRGMFESHSAVMLLIEPVTGRIVLANKAAERFYGYTASQLVSMCIQDINILPPAEVETELNLALHEPRNLFIFPHRLAGGEVRTVQVHSSPIDHNGELVLFSIIHDITESKRLEAERLEMERKLLHAQKLESLGVMAGGIAHDFNNLLMAILGNLEFALTDLGLGAKGKKAIENAIQASERSAELSHQMLIYSGKLFYVPKDLDLGELAFKLAHENEYLFNSVIPKTTTLNYKINKGLPLIRGDADQIQRVITNLVINASESIGANAGEVTLGTGIMDCDESYLSLSRYEERPEPGEFVFLEVTDTGCGMDAETQHKLFDPFFTTKFWGRGLGMAELIGIVKGHHGAIMVDSEVGNGTTIRVLFPVPKDAQALPVQIIDIIETESPASDSVGRRKTILLVEDEELVRGMILGRLELLGYDTIAAVDGVEGVRIFRERLNEIDLVLLDFVMPRMNGVEAFEELIRIKPDVKVILSSGYAEEVVLQRFPGPQPAGILHKPYKLEVLKDELDRVLGTDG
jgi:PAS domain S-box-containing protein